ncbi:MAG: hypothetical protein Q9219_007016 [cf. Caloplaca sp. 3 TL-2023]
MQVLVSGIVATISAGVHYGMGKHQDHQTASELINVIKANMFECTPISAFWDLESVFKNQMGCVNIITMDIITNSWSAFEDLVIWALPIPVLWKLRVPLAQKAGLYTLIGISFIAVICAFVRVSAFVIWINSSEISWNFPLYPLLCTIETCTALITSSLPAIYALFRKPAPEHRRSAVIQDSEKAWGSQGSTLRSATAGDRRSRWSFLAWHGFSAKKVDDGIASVPEEPHQDVTDEDQSDRKRTMTAYVSSTDEARSSIEKGNSHRRKISTETESLCYVGKGTDTASTITTSTREVR